MPTIMSHACLPNRDSAYAQGKALWVDCIGGEKGIRTTGKMEEKRSVQTLRCNPTEFGKRPGDKHV